MCIGRQNVIRELVKSAHFLVFTPITCHSSEVSACVDDRLTTPIDVRWTK